MSQQSVAAIYPHGIRSAFQLAADALVGVGGRVKSDDGNRQPAGRLLLDLLNFSIKRMLRQVFGDVVRLHCHGPGDLSPHVFVVAACQFLFQSATPGRLVGFGKFSKKGGLHTKKI